MNKSSTFAKGALAAAAGLVALGAAAAATAQPYDGGGYDPCRREANGRGVTGALVGGAGGAVIGSQLAASGHRTDGSLLGGIVGAIAGAAVGHNTAACTNGPLPPYSYRETPPPPPPPPGPSAYYEPAPRPYDGVDYAPPPPPRYVQRETVWAYGRHGVRLRVVEDRAGPDGCTVAESPVYMPDGGVDRRFVRVCPDYSGRYRVVD